MERRYRNAAQGGRMRIAGRVALITGGASGLGAAVARMIVEAGGRALIADRNTQLGGALALELGANPPSRKPTSPIPRQSRPPSPWPASGSARRRPSP